MPNSVTVYHMLYRNLPIFERAFAKKDEQKGYPAVRLVTLWLGEPSPQPSIHQQTGRG